MGKCACGQGERVRSERAGKCGFEDMAGKCGRGKRESAPVGRAGKCGFGDMAGKCAWGHDRTVRLLKPAIRVLQNPKWRPIASLNYRFFSDNLRFFVQCRTSKLIILSQDVTKNH